MHSLFKKYLTLHSWSPCKAYLQDSCSLPGIIRHHCIWSDLDTSTWRLRGYIGKSNDPFVDRHGATDVLARLPRDCLR